MASDSLFGGGDDSGGDGGGGLLDAEDRALLDSLLADFVGGPAVDFDGGQLLNGTGPGGERQGAQGRHAGRRRGGKHERHHARGICGDSSGEIQLA